MNAPCTNGGAVLSHYAVERLAAVLVAGMVREAAYGGQTVTAAEISEVVVSDPEGATADYFRRSAAGALDLIAKFQADPELLAIFAGEGA